MIFYFSGVLKQLVAHLTNETFPLLRHPTDERDKELFST